MALLISHSSSCTNQILRPVGHHHCVIAGWNPYIVRGRGGQGRGGRFGVQGRGDAGASISGGRGASGGPGRGQQSSSPSVLQVQRRGAALEVVPPASLQPVQTTPVHPAPSPAAAVESSLLQPASSSAVPVTGAAVQPRAGASSQASWGAPSTSAPAATVPAAAQQGGSVAASMYGFPAHAAGEAVASIVREIMSAKLPHVFYMVLPAMTSNGIPVASLTFPDLSTAKWTVQQLDGQQHGNVHISMQLSDPVHVQPPPPPPPTCQHTQVGMPLAPPPPPPPAHGQPQSSPAQACYGQVYGGQANWQSQAGQTSRPGFGSPVHDAQASGGQAGGSQACNGQPNAGAATGGVQGGAVTRQPSSTEGSGPVVACAQQCSERPKLIQLIHQQVTGQTGEQCQEFEDLKGKLNRMKVLFTAVLTLPPCI